MTTSPEIAAAKGWIVAFVACGFISLAQFAPSYPEGTMLWYTNIHATILIWCVAVLSMFMVSISAE